MFKLSDKKLSTILCPNICFSGGLICITIWAITWQSQQNKFVQSQDWNNSEHFPSLITAFAVCSVGNLLGPKPFSQYSISANYSETCLKRPLKKKTKNWFSRQIIAKCRSKVLQNALREHSAILSTFTKPPLVFNTFVLSILEWPLKTGFTVYWNDCKINSSLCGIL